jgi:hypothetical protein
MDEQDILRHRVRGIIAAAEGRAEQLRAEARRDALDARRESALDALEAVAEVERELHVALHRLSATAERLAAAGALVGTSDHGTTKSLYGQDPDGLEFEIVWLVPAALLDDTALAARKRIGRLDLDAERRRYGGQTRGGVGISVPA